MRNGGCGVLRVRRFRCGNGGGCAASRPCLHLAAPGPQSCGQASGSRLSTGGSRAGTARFPSPRSALLLQARRYLSSAPQKRARSGIASSQPPGRAPLRALTVPGPGNGAGRAAARRVGAGDAAPVLPQGLRVKQRR